MSHEHILPSAGLLERGMMSDGRMIGSGTAGCPDSVLGLLDHWIRDHMGLLTHCDRGQMIYILQHAAVVVE